MSFGHKPLDKSNFIKLFAKLYDYALIPAHCSSSFPKAGIFQSLINTNSRQLSFSVQFEPAPRNRYQISNPITIVKSDKLTKFSSTLNLHN
ncbi:unnamed protein product [Rotaria socialis]|uniref:Uncharacterized protein n=1 Tax=Rotaria socialis TaxID=392032 RepID=A0A821K4M9_9BILA|nr:unnamed protein product [Rotaria socialis]